MAQKNKKATYTSPIATFGGKPVQCDVWILKSIPFYHEVTHIEGRKTGVLCLKKYITI